MNILEVSQVIFNLTASFAIIVVGILASVMLYDIIKFTRSVKKLFSDIREESEALYKKLDNFFQSISNLSFFPKLFGQKKSNKK